MPLKQGDNVTKLANLKVSIVHYISNKPNNQALPRQYAPRIGTIYMSQEITA